ncbi:glycosyltransferase family 4 protein, partial [Escherichia coli]|nr:glycosyltransferase family 4 protein [Escherichia coli]EJM1116276.1 glycosyltransferase family 4 protein [Escherichia coli]EJM1528228.1 glycosyltransferase family 4 protein [Escherichia coli]
TPVIAFGKGGVLETIRPYGVQNPTGLFFDNQKVADIINAIQEFEKISHKILPIDCRSNAIRFSNERFQAEINDYINKKWDGFNEAKRIEY